MRTARRCLAILLLAGALAAGQTPVATSVRADGPTLAAAHHGSAQRYGRDRKQHYYAWIPPNPATRMAVVTVHGGSWVNGDTRRMDVYNRRFYTLGIPSFSVDYRPAGRAPWPRQRTDLAVALDSIRSRAAAYRIDPERIAVVGSSAGGHLVLSVASTEGRALTCAAVAYSPPTSMALVRRQARKGPLQRSLYRSSRVLAPTRSLARSASLPVTPSASDAPALLFAGQREWLTSANSTGYVAAYRRRHVDLDVRAVVLAGQKQHGGGYATRDRDVWTRTMTFLRAHC